MTAATEAPAVDRRRSAALGNRPLGPPRRRRSGWALRRWILVVGTITVLYAIVAVGFGWFALARLADTRALVIEEIQPAMLASQDLSSALLNQESGVRGYSLTGLEEFLTPYVDGRQATQQAVDRLRLLAGSQHLGDLLADVDRVLQKAQAWRMTFADPTIAAIRATGQPASPVDPEVGKALFDEVRTELTAMDNDLGTLLDQATTRLQAAADFVLAVFLGVAIGMAVLVIAVGLWLRRAVTNPLSRLATEVRDVVSGDVHREVRVGGPREIVQLAEDVDAMRRHILTELDTLEVVHRRLDEQARDLERSNRDLEQFAYVASHDLQEPLRKVSSFCQLLKRRYAGQLDERADSYISFAVDGAQRMQQLINDLLAFSRVGRLVRGMEPVDLNAVAEAALGQLATIRDETDARITVGELPTVRGEASLLTQLLANLIGNALKFRRPDVPPEITVDAQQHPDGWAIRVVDNGIGVEPEYADKVFVIFQRLHSRDEYPGTGIGLAMAKKIVEYHGGRIWLDRDRTDGTTVRFTLPVHPEQTDPEQATVDEEPEP